MNRRDLTPINCRPKLAYSAERDTSCASRAQILKEEVRRGSSPIASQLYARSAAIGKSPFISFVRLPIGPLPRLPVRPFALHRFVGGLPLARAMSFHPTHRPSGPR